MAVRSKEMEKRETCGGAAQHSCVNYRVLRTSESFYDHSQVWRSEIGYDRPARGKLAITSDPHLELQKSELPPANVGLLCSPSRIFSDPRCVLRSRAKFTASAVRVLYEKGCAVVAAAQWPCSSGRLGCRELFPDQLRAGEERPYGSRPCGAAGRAYSAFGFAVRLFGVSGRWQDRRAL